MVKTLSIWLVPLRRILLTKRNLPERRFSFSTGALAQKFVKTISMRSFLKAMVYGSMIGGLVSISSGEISPVELGKLRATWVEANERDAKPIKKKYLAALKALRTQLTQRGDLEGAVVVRNEIEALTKDGKRPEAK